MKLPLRCLDRIPRQIFMLASASIPPFVWCAPQLIFYLQNKDHIWWSLQVAYPYGIGPRNILMCSNKFPRHGCFMRAIGPYTHGLACTNIYATTYWRVVIALRDWDVLFMDRVDGNKAPFIGSIGQFDPKTEFFVVYLECLKLFVTANGIAEAKLHAVFLLVHWREKYQGI